MVNPPNAARTMTCKAWNFPLEYTKMESKHDIKEFEDNMFNPIFKENVQAQKAETCIYNENNGHKSPIIVTTIMMKILMK